MRSASALLVLVVLGACGGGGSAYDHPEPLPGIFGPQIRALAFDSRNRPLAGGDSGLWRYTDADGWVNVGVPDVGPTTSSYTLFPAADGSTYIATGLRMYELGLDDPQWVQRRDWTAGATTLENRAQVQYVAPDGTMYGTVSTSNGLLPVTWSPAGSDWVQTDLVPGQVATDGTTYVVTAEGIARRAAGTTALDSLVDCRQKQLLQCNATLRLLRVLGDHLYFSSKAISSQEVYRVAVTGGDIELVAALRTEPPPADYVYFNDLSLTDNGTVYITAARSSDAYSYGSTFRFAPGHSTGKLVLESPTDFDLTGSEPQAPDANIVVAPDDTMYWVRYVNGDIGRYD